MSAVTYSTPRGYLKKSCGTAAPGGVNAWLHFRTAEGGGATQALNRRRWLRWALAAALSVALVAAATGATQGEAAKDEAGKPASPAKAPDPAPAASPAAPATPAEAPKPAASDAPKPPPPPAFDPAPTAAPVLAAAPAPAAVPAPTTGQAATPTPPGNGTATTVVAEAAPELPAAPLPPPPPPQIEVKDGNTIELHVKNQDLSTVLELLSRECRLNILASKKATGKVTADLYHTSLDQTLTALCRTNGLRWVREGDFIYIHTPEEMTALADDDTRMKTEVFPLNWLTSQDAQKIITPALSKKAAVSGTVASDVGIPSTNTEAGGNKYGLGDALLIRDYPENLDNVRAILKLMDGRPRQVLVEATILSVSLTDANSLGINFNSLAGVDFRDLSNTATPVTDPSANANDPTSTLDIANKKGGQPPWAQARTLGFATAGTGLNVGIITHNISILISALESITDTTVIGNPKVLALNKQRAEVIVGERIGYQTATTTQTATIQDVQFLDTGTQLVFRPFIADDNYVRLEVHPKVSTGQLVNNLPQENTTEVTCNVMVKSGNTIVIGGLFSETSSISHSQVPGLGNIPWLGALFRSRNESSDRREIIILLTPHIIEDDTAAAVGAQVMDDIKRRGLGLREGFAFYSRERLSVTYLHEADKAWQRYEKSNSMFDLGAAWWDTEMTLNVAPNNLKAMRLKDRIFQAFHGWPREVKAWTLWDSIKEEVDTWGPAPLGGDLSAAPADDREDPVKAAAQAVSSLESKVAPARKPGASSTAPQAADPSAKPAAPDDKTTGGVRYKGWN